MTHNCRDVRTCSISTTSQRQSSSFFPSYVRLPLFRSVLFFLSLFSFHWGVFLFRELRVSVCLERRLLVWVVNKDLKGNGYRVTGPVTSQLAWREWDETRKHHPGLSASKRRLETFSDKYKTNHNAWGSLSCLFLFTFACCISSFFLLFLCSFVAYFVHLNIFVV